jgi:hypothetical protein
LSVCRATIEQGNIKISILFMNYIPYVFLHLLKSLNEMRSIIPKSDTNENSSVVETVHLFPFLYNVEFVDFNTEISHFHHVCNR